MTRPKVILILFTSFAPAFGQATVETKTTQQEPRTVRELLNQSIGWYEVFANDKVKKPVEAKQVLRWTNPARNNVTDGLSAVYEHNGRPIAMVGIFPSGGDRITHEFHLLARKHGVFGRDGSKSFWQPKRSEILEFRAVPNAKPPSGSARRRLLQMKRMAERFQVELLGWNATDSDREMLRRLTTEVHRYGKENTDTLDGTIFAFCVNGTDPEAFLQIEAYSGKKNGPYEWQYAFTKSTGARMEARLDKKQVVWKTTKFPPMYEPELAFRAIYRAIDHGHLPNK